MREEEPEGEPASVMLLKLVALLLLVVGVAFSIRSFLEPTEPAPMRLIFAHPLVYLLGL